MLTSIYFLEIHLHTVAYLNLNLNHTFIIKMNEDLPTEVGHNNVTTLKTCLDKTSSAH